jgi:hypothetical protein
VQKQCFALSATASVGSPPTASSGPSSTSTIHRKTTRRILKAPLGSFDSRDWHQADWTLSFWNTQRSPESVSYSFRLLDRFVEEYSHQLKDRTKESTTSLPLVLSTAALNYSVDNWRLCAKYLMTSARRLEIPDPTEMLEKIDNFRSFAQTNKKNMKADFHRQLPLMPNILTYSMVLDGLAFAQPDVPRESPSHTPAAKNKPDCHGNLSWEFTGTPAPILSQKLLDRLIKESKKEKSLQPTIVSFNSVINAWARSRTKEAPMKAQAVLRQIQELSKQVGWEDLHPTISTYGSIIHCWANSREKEGAQQTEALLEELKESTLPNLQPNGEIYLGVLKAWAHSEDSQAAESAYKILREMMEWYKASPHHYRENGAPEKENFSLPLNCFLAMINIFVKRGDAKKASEILDQLHDFYEEQGHDEDLCPNTAVFNGVLKAWSKSRSRKAADYAEAILQRMQDLTERTGYKCQPDLQSYNAVLAALSKSSARDALQRAQKILNILEESPGGPDLISYNTCLALLARSKRKDAGDLAERLLCRMWQLHSTGAINFTPDAVSYNTCIYAYNQSSNMKSAERAESLFREMQEQYKLTGDPTLKANRFSYGAVISAFARNAEKAQCVFDEMIASGINPTTIEINALIHAWASKGGVDRAEIIVDKMLDDYMKGNKAAKPDTKSFSSVLNALAKARSKDPWSTAQRAEALLVRMVEISNTLSLEARPNSWCFNAVLECYSRCRSNEAAAFRAEKILMHMQAMSEAGNRNVKPNVISYTTTMNCWVNSRGSRMVPHVEALFRELKRRFVECGDRDLKPTQYTYNALIGAYCRDMKRLDAINNAIYYFDDMMNQYNSTGDKDFQPGPMHFSAIMGAFGRRGMAEEAELFLQRAIEICEQYKKAGGDQLDIGTSFNALISAYATSGIAGSAEKAEQTLRRMLEVGSEGESFTALASVVSYTTVLKAWSLANSEEEKNVAVERSEALLKEMLHCVEAGNRALMPNSRTFGTLLETISRSNLPDQQQRAQALLTVMRESGVRADDFVLKMVKELSERPNPS